MFKYCTCYCANVQQVWYFLLISYTVYCVNDAVCLWSYFQINKLKFVLISLIIMKIIIIYHHVTDVLLGRRMGRGSIWLPRSDCRWFVIPQGGADPCDGAHRCRVEERKTGGERGALPCCLHTALPGYNTHSYSKYIRQKTQKHISFKSIN